MPAPNLDVFDPDIADDSVEYVPPSNIVSSIESSIEERVKSYTSSLLSRGRGRPTKLTPENMLAVVKLIRAGTPQDVAANSIGICVDTFCYWIRRGAQDLAKNKRSIYSDFSIAVLIANRELEAELATKWKKIVTEPTTKRKAVYKEQIVNKEDGSHEVVRYCESETVETVGDGDWRGISDYMWKRFPKRWKRIETVEQSGPDGGPIPVQVASINPDDLSPETRARLLEEIKLIGAGSTENAEMEAEQENGNR